jgi:hypothetical protein
MDNKVKVDLVKRREEDIKTDKYKIDAEAQKVIDEQNELGKYMDQHMARERMLREDPAKFDTDPSLFLYRLPLNEDQIKAIHKNLTADNK